MKFRNVLTRTTMSAGAVGILLVAAGNVAQAAPDAAGPPILRAASATESPGSKASGAARLAKPAPTFSYVALGDSFSAGDGNKAGGWVNQSGVADKSAIANDGCNRSSQGYPELTSKWMKKDKNLPQMSFAFLACSGATTTDVWSGSPSAQDGLMGASGDNGESEQVSYPQLSNARIVTLTAGGNDLNFSDIISNCIDSLLHSCDANSNDGWIAELGPNIQTLESSLVATYEQVRTDAPSAQVFVLGYPDVFTSASTTGCQGLSGSAISYLASEQDPLNAVIQSAASQAGINYVDPNSGPNSFVGHDMCASSSQRWFNSLNVTGTGSGASFHPNKQGQAAMAATLESAIATANPAITPGSKSNALIYGDGDWEDPSNTSFQNISDALVGIGDNTTQMPGTNILPTGFSSYGQIWLDTIDPISSADEWSLEAFVKNGGSLYLNGEWGSTSEFDNQTVQDILNALVANPPSVTGNLVAESAQPVNASVLDSLAVTPNPLTTWTPTDNGDLSGVAKKNVLFSDGSGASGAAWQVGSNGGRLVVLMDVNWAQSEYMDSATMPQVAANIGYFLGH